MIGSRGIDATRKWHGNACAFGVYRLAAQIKAVLPPKSKGGK